MHFTMHSSSTFQEQYMPPMHHKNVHHSDSYMETKRWWMSAFIFFQCNPYYTLQSNMLVIEMSMIIWVYISVISLSNRWSIWMHKQVQLAQVNTTHKQKCFYCNMNIITLCKLKTIMLFFFLVLFIILLFCSFF